MKFLKILLGIIGALIAIFIIITLFLPSEAEVERSIEINAPASKVFPLVNSMKNWAKWSSWHEIDSTAKWEYSGPEFGVGSTQKWESQNQNLGTGQIEIIESKPNELIKTKLQFFGNDFGQGIWTFEEKEGKTKVTWKMHADLAFFERWFALGMDAMVGPMFEKGLSEIKKIAESSPEAKIEVLEDDVPAQLFLAIKKVTDMNPENIQNAFSEAFGELAKFSQMNNIRIVGPPSAITNEFDHKSWNFYAAFPIASKVKTDGNIEIVELPASHVIKVIMKGPYEASVKAYETAYKYLEEKGFKENGKSWETYMNDPTTVKPEEIETHIFIPVKK